MTFSHSHTLFPNTNSMPGSKPASSGKNLLELFTIELVYSSSQFYELACKLQEHTQVLTNELIYSVTEEAFFNALELARFLARNDPQHFDRHKENVRQFEKSWNDLCARREEFLFNEVKFESTKKESIEPKKGTAGSLQQMAESLYVACYDFHLLARDLSKHPDIFKDGRLLNLASASYALAVSKMAVLEAVAYLFGDYDARLQRFIKDQEDLKDSYVKHFLVPDASAPGNNHVKCS